MKNERPLDDEAIKDLLTNRGRNNPTEDSKKDDDGKSPKNTKNSHTINDERIERFLWPEDDPVAR